MEHYLPSDLLLVWLNHFTTQEVLSCKNVERGGKHVTISKPPPFLFCFVSFHVEVVDLGIYGVTEEVIFIRCVSKNSSALTTSLCKPI